MGRISREVIERINDTADIVDVVSQYVDLKKRGRNYFGLCPFHHEKTASFSVAPDKNIYHCFGCGVGGSAINFLMEFEKISFVEAVKKLGDRYNITVELEQDGTSHEFFTQLYELQELAAQRYVSVLFSAQGKPALEYLTGRGLSEELIRTFRLGYAPDKWEDLINNTRSKQYSDDVLEKSGLFTKSDKGRFDRFRSRIMFPIMNPAGKVIAFGGRIFNGEDPAKYLNSPETPLYHKSDVLYGLHHTRDAIRSQETLVLVEGYMDFLTLYQTGIKNVVAVSGTALTQRHAAQIRKVAQKVYLAYDGDDAGIAATLRSGYTLYRGSVEPQVIPVPSGQDPDDWVRSDKGAAFKAAMKKPLRLVDFHIKVKNAADLRGIERSQFVNDLLKEVGSIEDGILRNEILRVIGQRLVIDERDLLQVLQKQKKRRFSPDFNDDLDTNQAELAFTGKLQRAQVEIIRILAQRNQEALGYARDHLDLNVFSEPVLKTLAGALLKSGDDLSLASILDQFEKKQEREAVAKLLFANTPSDTVDPVMLIRECLSSMREQPLRDQIKQLRLKIRDLDAADKDSTAEILEIASLQKQLKELAAANQVET